MAVLDRVVDHYLPAVEQELKSVLVSPNQYLSSFYGMMHYHFGWVDESFRPIDNWGGKRLRPMLCLLTCEAAGGDFRRALPAAAAVEIVHNFSLAHDDIQDGDKMRRHRRALWNVWGMPLALNVGDGLFALAHLAMARLVDVGTSPSQSMAATAILDQTSMALIQGQYLDVAFEKRLQVKQQDYLDMVAGKTAALFACATELGAMLTSDGGDAVDHYRSYGHNLGLAFQMTDDILGIWGDPKVTGKSRASDITSKKKTLPIVYALEKSPLLVEIYQQDHIDANSLETVLTILDKVEALHYTQNMADHYKNRALGELGATGRQNGAQDQLKDLTHFLTTRSY